MILGKIPFFVFLFVSFFYGCSFKIPHYRIPDYEKKQIRLIAVLPVEADLCDPQLADFLRRSIVESLYFKGYPRMLIPSIDEKWLTLKWDDFRKQLPGTNLGVDAVMRAKLMELSTKFNFIYAIVNIRIDFELLSAKTGELLWGISLKESEVVTDITPSRLRLRTVQIYEPCIQTIVERAMKTFPDAFGTEEA